MFKINGNYPYPILLEKNIDYKISKIKVKYLYKSVKEGHEIRILCEVGNKEIESLIREHKACYAVQIESPNALYRKMFEFYDKDEIVIGLKNMEVIDYIDIGFAILSKEDLDNYQNNDFVDAYKNIKMKVNKNEVLAVYPNVRQAITSNDEILREVHSIFNLQKSANIENITYDPNYDRILVKVPEEIGNYYLISKENKDKINILNSIIFLPILSSIVRDMSDYESEFIGRLWFKTLNNKIEELMKTNKISRDTIYDNPFETSQMLLKNIGVESIIIFKKMLENLDGDDE